MFISIYTSFELYLIINRLNGGIRLLGAMTDGAIAVYSPLPPAASMHTALPQLPSEVPCALAATD
jgi:hypothetical protein